MQASAPVAHEPHPEDRCFYVLTLVSKGSQYPCDRRRSEHEHSQHPFTEPDAVQAAMLTAVDEIITVAAVNQDDDSDFVYINRKVIRELETTFDAALEQRNE